MTENQMAICELFRKHPDAWFSAKDTCLKARVSERVTRPFIKRLCKQGFLTQAEKFDGRKRMIYRLTCDKTHPILAREIPR